MCRRFVFLLITRTVSWLRLSRRGETWRIAETLILRHQLAVLQRRQPCRPGLNWADRALLASLLGVIPKARRQGLRLLVTPDTMLRWHRDIVRRRWAARSMRGKTGRPATRRNMEIGRPDRRLSGRWSRMSPTAARLARRDPGSAIGPARRCGIPAAPPGFLAGVRQHGLDDGRGGGRDRRRDRRVLDRLIGFGLDSVIEFFAAAVVVWQLRGTVAEERESRALRLIGGTFFALAVYLAIESVTDLVSQHRPEQSTAGIAVTAAALVVMPLLALAKRRTGQMLGNRALVADAAESAFCVPSPPPPHWLASGSTAGWSGGGPTRRQLLSSRAWRSGRVSKPGRKMTTDQDQIAAESAGSRPSGDLGHEVGAPLCVPCPASWSTVFGVGRALAASA